jgi:hypothetical protein
VHSGSDARVCAPKWIATTMAGMSVCDVSDRDGVVTVVVEMDCGDSIRRLKKILLRPTNLNDTSTASISVCCVHQVCCAGLGVHLVTPSGARPGCDVHASRLQFVLHCRPHSAGHTVWRSDDLMLSEFVHCGHDWQLDCRDRVLAHSRGSAAESADNLASAGSSTPNVAHGLSDWPGRWSDA